MLIQKGRSADFISGREVHGNIELEAEVVIYFGEKGEAVQHGIEFFFLLECMVINFEEVCTRSWLLRTERESSKGLLFITILM
ncbi:hypothetical protein VIGAN_01180900 [Vigna angularis var. angularis]|uniref:Uncharacterized protein n=1 Tax=Vigna angularis var. angularis TaxID=157739 RepID=A0A0S3R0R9_PHAAN|nr:hypothetical protein VIGAN_01180900 [Vigna angularis var. angularis]